jgi:hypothetical protein
MRMLWDQLYAKYESPHPKLGGLLTRPVFAPLRHQLALLVYCVSQSAKEVSP